jgi:hypothetical protein
MAFSPPRSERVAAVLLFGIAGLLAVRIIAGYFASEVMATAYLAWCAETGYPVNEYALDCGQTVGFLEATSRLLPGELASIAIVTVLAIAVLAGSRTGRILTCIASLVFPLWAALSMEYYLYLPRRLANAAVLSLPEVTPRWYLVLCATIGPLTASLLLVAAVIIVGNALRARAKPADRPV